MSFQDVKDQAASIRLLRNMLARGRTPNGLLFWGPGGVGKHLTAMEFAKAINCVEHADDACDQCLACRKVMHGNHPDVKTITPSGKTRGIGVDTVDQMNELAAYRPFESAWRVFLIVDADRMRIEAQNHFLKTLEEPPSNTVFVLLTEHPRRLLPTIRSRCQQVRFGALRPETVTELLLAQRDLPQEVAEALAAVSQGQVARALNLVDSDKRDIALAVAHKLAKGEDPLAVSEEFAGHLKAHGESVRAAVKAQFEEEEPDDASREDREALKKEQMAYAEALIRRDLMEYLYLLESWYRDALVYHATSDPKTVMNRDQLSHLEAAGAGPDLEEKLGAIEKSWRYVERNLNVDRVFRDLFFALAPKPG